MIEDLHYAGEFILEAVDIIQPNGLALDIREVVNQLTIYEDLFSPFMSGNLICYDSQDLPSILKQGGVDLLRISVRTPSLEKEHHITRYFHIYKLGDREEINDRSQTYIFYFMSVENIEDTSNSISKTFKGPGEEIISSLLTNYLKTNLKFNYSKTENSVVYTSNFWSPSKNIAFISDHSLGKNKQPDMVFYESRAGFNFSSLLDISSKKPSKSFATSDHVSTLTTQSSVKKTFDKDYAQILLCEITQRYDYLQAKRTGGIHTRLFAYDYNTKQLVDTTYNLYSDKTRKWMNDLPIYKKNVVENSYRGNSGVVNLMTTKLNSLYTNSGDVSDAAYKQRRINILKSFNQKIEITVFGRTDYTVGQTVFVDMNRLKPIDKDMETKDISNPLITGNFIISAISHRFNRNGKHEATLELIRDSINK